MARLSIIAEDSICDYSRSGRKLLMHGDWYPVDPSDLQRVMVRRGYGLSDQLRYLHQAQEAYAVEFPHQIAVVGGMIAERQRLLQTVSESLAETKRLMDAYRAIGSLPDVMLAASERSHASPQPSHSFYWCHRQVSGRWVRDLQKNLWNRRLLLAPDDGRDDAADDLPLALGVGPMNKKLQHRLVWLGKINQLHCFVNLLIDQGFVACHSNAKWLTAADLFELSHHKPLQPKRISDASDIKYDDEEAVKTCFPIVG